ncbi:pilus assembly protein TadG-related protein [Phytoactinopolyspora halotolerans]|uniref:Putative Flp pilus-assembly TadG-like N-terminal domain-containing protein n=1 Tax=Phytoactinopolyspora halotolerans TaxID=1981512 RepID=A0A6L9SFS7_9ACTN|nr:pilus assembly protein TadG-related protein [Phytoactinopolyspora halotolerans]NEE03302.1 hypothetical protein [Phytoactinopolyspora halotolerans]
MSRRHPHEVPHPEPGSTHRSGRRIPRGGRRRRLARTRRRESGQITIMIVGFAVILGLAVAVVANASHLFLQRRALASWADGAVTAAAQHAAHDVLYGGVPLSSLPVSEAAAREAVVDYAARHGLTGRFEEFRVAHVAVDPDARRVTVELQASVSLLVAGDVTAGAGAFTVTARSSAVVPFE